MKTNEIIWGWTGLFHDASLAVFVDQQLVFAAHSERYSRIKNDPYLNQKIVNEALSFGKPQEVYFYERPLIKKSRQLWAGQYYAVRKQFPTSYLRKFYKNAPRSIGIHHHWSHAAACYYTRPFIEEPVCVVIDAIGEWDTASIWYKKKKVWSLRYPKSLGLFYSAVTQECALRPNEDEYITMGMAAFGRAKHHYDPYLNYHKGFPEKLRGHNYDKAASAQLLIEQEIYGIMKKARKYSSSLCYGGGVALNCVANSKIHNMFDKVWIMPNPGDAGSAIGCVLAATDYHIDWPGPYLGHNIPGEYPVNQIINELNKTGVVGVASGKAEFGPRALGNRSLLANPMLDIKDTVNKIKRRQQFRPFAPAILEEYFDEYYEGPAGPYMQYVAKAKHDMKSVIHYDGTSRVQLVKKDNTGFRKLLEKWHDQTGCPMLLNTSLNIKGEPLVNTILDAKEWQDRYKVKVCLPRIKK